MSRRLPSFGVVLLLALLASCAKPPQRATTRVTLLPQADGSASAVTVRASAGNNTEEQRLGEPYQVAVAARDQPVTVATEDAEKVRKVYGTLFTTAPPLAARFVVYFRSGTTELTRESQQSMVQVLADARTRSGAEIVVTGYTDTTGAGDANDALSLRRANIVRDQFIAQGFPAALVMANGRGERELSVPTADNVNEARNRRVTITVR